MTTVDAPLICLNAASALAAYRICSDRSSDARAFDPQSVVTVGQSIAALKR